MSGTKRGREEATYASPLPPAPRARLASWISLVEIGLWVVAGLGLGAAAWMAGDALRYQRWADAVLDSAESAGPPAPGPLEPGTPIGRLTIPRLEIETVVAEGVSRTVLQRAIGHVPSSARPGERGNVALAGHRDTFLRNLADVREGDLIELDGLTARARYRVEWTSVVDPADVHVLAETSYPALTMITCFPFRYVGPAPQRFVVRARKVDHDSPPFPKG